MRLGRREGGEKATKSDKIRLRFSETETAKQNQKFPFHFFFRFAAEGGREEGGAQEKCKEIFLASAHASPRACPRRIGSHHHAIGAYEAVSSHHALRACEVGSRKG